MKETKLKERFSKAFEAFFETTENSTQIETLETNGIERDTQLTSKKSLFVQIFKTLLSAGLYIPSALILGTFSFIVTLTEIFGVPSMMPLSYSITTDVMIRIFLVLGGVSLFSILGIGNIRDIRSLSIPFSIASTGVVLGLLFGLITMFDPMLRHYFLFPPNDGNVFYLLPVFLVAGVLAKNWMNSLPEEKAN